MEITFDETFVFTYCINDPSIGIWKNDKEKGRYGIPARLVGWLNFYDFEQMSLFSEMLDLSLKKQNRINCD